MVVLPFGSFWPTQPKDTPQEMVVCIAPQAPSPNSQLDSVHQLRQGWGQTCSNICACSKYMLFFLSCQPFARKGGMCHGKPGFSNKYPLKNSISNRGWCPFNGKPQGGCLNKGYKRVLTRVESPRPSCDETWQVDCLLKALQPEGPARGLKGFGG